MFFLLGLSLWLVSSCFESGGATNDMRCSCLGHVRLGWWSWLMIDRVDGIWVVAEGDTP